MASPTVDRQCHVYPIERAPAGNPCATRWSRWRPQRMISCPCRGRACAPWATSRRPGRTRRARSSRNRRGDPPTARPWRVSPPPPLQRHEQHAREKYRVVPPRAASARPGSGSMCRSRRPARRTPARAASSGSTVGGSARSSSSTAPYFQQRVEEGGGRRPGWHRRGIFPLPWVNFSSVTFAVRPAGMHSPDRVRRHRPR